MTIRVGFDIDDVLYPWFAQAHSVCVLAGLAGVDMPVTWHPYREYGITRAEWEDVLRAAVIDGSLHFGRSPIPEARKAIHMMRVKLIGLGLECVAITARGETFEDAAVPWLRDLVQAQTRLWLTRWGFTFDEVIFSTKKGEHGLDFLLDDNATNVRSVIASGGRGYLMTQTWNQDEDLPRVDTVQEYIDTIRRRTP